MGSRFNTYTYNGAAKELSDFHSEYQHEERLEGGSDTYAGHLGILADGLHIVDVKPYAFASDAREYIENNHSKWNCAFAVPFKGEVRDYDSASKKIIAQRKKAELDLALSKRKFLKQIKSTKSKTIGCKKCGSAITRSYLSEAVCPVCRGDLLTATQLSQLKSRKIKLSKLNQQSLQKISKTGTCYIVGGWCPE